MACFDAETGKILWQQLYPDFLSDTIYLRYATSSPTIDPETGNVYIQDTQGIFAGFNADGQTLVGTFHDGGIRAADLSQWPHGLAGGGQGFGHHAGHHGQLGRATARPRTAFMPLTKKPANGLGLDPGGRPKDNSYSHPILAWLDGRRVFYAATGDGAVVCVNARTGDPIFRIPLFKAGHQLLAAAA